MKKNNKIKNNEINIIDETLSVLLKEDYEAILFYCLFVRKILTKTELQIIMLEFGYTNFDIWYGEYIQGNLLEEVKYKKESKINAYVYIKSTDLAKEKIILISKYNKIKTLIETTDNNCKEITNIQCIQDGIDLAIRLHNNIEHFHCIYCLYNCLLKENINVSNILNQVNANVVKNPRVFRFKNYKKVQPDLSILYNNKTIFIEVERGNTTKEDMYDKLAKYQLMDRESQPKMDVIIFAAPNQKDLDATKKKVKEWEKRFDYDYTVGNVNMIRDLKFVYINISKINKKNTVRKILYNAFR